MSTAICGGGPLCRGCLFTDLVPAPHRTKLSIRPRSRAGSPALPPRVPLLGLRGAHPAAAQDGSGLHPAAREYFPSHHCALSKPGTCMLACGPPPQVASQCLRIALLPVRCPTCLMSYRFCCFSKLPFFSLCLSLCLCSRFVSAQSWREQDSSFITEFLLFYYLS